MKVTASPLTTLIATRSNLKRVALILGVSCLPGFTFAGDLKPFTSDGCSAFPDGTLEHNKLWLKCCTEHDYAYWKGGTSLERQESDLALKQCVSKIGEKEIALIMLAGVRIGGSPYLPTQFRWGYGWPYPKHYRALTEAELEEVSEHSTTTPEGIFRTP